MSRHTRRTGPARGPLVGSGGRSIDSTLPLSYDSDGHPRCWRCGQPTGMALDGRPTCHACRYIDDAHPDDHETSRGAARHASRGVGSPLARAILAELRRRGRLGAIDDELRRAIPGHAHGSYSRRRGDLVEAGLVRDSGRTRLSDAGRASIVWEVVAR